MKKLLTIIICAMGIVFLEANPAEPATLEVRAPAGIGTLGDVYTCIQDAIDDASDGDELIIHDGTYTETLTITDKGLTLTGEDESTVIVQASETGPYDGNNVLTINAGGKDITIQNMTIRNGDYGIRSGAGNVNVLHCTFYHNGWDGAGLPDPETAPLEDFVYFWNNSGHVTDGGAMRIENSAGSEIAYCSVYDNDRGIRFQNGDNGNIHNNVSHDNIESGIYLAASSYSGATGCTNTDVNDNECYGNMNNGILSIGGHTNTIRNNDVYDNWTSGIAADYPSEITIQGNTINNNNVYGFTGEGTQGENHGGIFMSGSTDVASRTFTAEILSNTISNNNSGTGTDAEGIRITSSVYSDGIDIENNTFTNHDIHILVLSQADTIIVHNNSFNSDGTIGVQNNDTSATLDAEYNWWGDASGPYNLAGNPDGQGDEVSDYVDYEPWYATESMLAPVVVYIDDTANIRAVSETIQGGVDAAHDGDTVVVSAGTYDEQVFIDESLTLIGAGAATTTIRAPDSMDTVLVRGGSQAIQGVVNVIGATAHGITVDVNGFTVDGNYVEPASSSTWFAGIVYSDANGIIQNNIITKVRQATLGEGSASWRGHGVWLGDASTVTVKENTISQWQRNGVEIRDAAATATITDNTFTGYETPYTVVNAVTFYGATDGTVSGNIITDCRYTGAGSGNDFYGGTQACGIMSYEGLGTFTVTDNTIQDCDMGIYSRLASAGIIADNTIEDNLYFGIVFRKGDVTATGNTITGSEVGILIPSSRPASSSAPAANCNKISGNSVYGVRNDAAYSTDANSNWWGSASGPNDVGGGSGDAVSTNVDFFPWLLTDNIEACAELTQVAPDFVVDDDWVDKGLWETVTVDSTDYYIGLNAFAAIQDAVTAASDGNSISVADGNYVGAIVNEDLTIIGANPGGSVITDGPHYGGGHPTAKTAFKVDADADGLEIKNFTIDCNAADNFYFAIFSRSANDVVVDSLTVNNPVQGITNYGGSNWQITNNLINYTEAAGGGGIAIYLGAYPPDYTVLNGNIVRGNTITATATAPTFTCPGISMALDLRYDRYGSLTGNEDISYNMIVDNDIEGTGAASEVGIEIGVIGLEGDPDKIAATLGLIHDNTVRNNIIENTDWGIYFYTVTDLRVLGNEIIDCNEGIHMKDGHTGIAINYNAIYGSESYGLNNNTDEVVDAELNWWGDISGPNDPDGMSDTDGVTCYEVSEMKNDDGLGDVVTQNADYCPWLIAPVSPSDNPYMAGDLNFDGCVDFRDVAILALNWLEGCE